MQKCAFYNVRLRDLVVGLWSKWIVSNGLTHIDGWCEISLAIIPSTDRGKSVMRPDKRARQAALLADPTALGLYLERQRNRAISATVASNQGLKAERLNWRKDKSFDRDYVLGKCYHAPREMKAAIGSIGGPKGRHYDPPKGYRAPADKRLWRKLADEAEAKRKD